MRLELQSIGEALPGRDLPGLHVSNEMLTEAVERFRSENHLDFPLPDADFPRDRVGVLQRRFLQHDLTAYDMSLTAARQAVQKASTRPEDYRVVVVSSVTYQACIPPQAARLQADLGLSNDVMAFDTPMGCNGFLAGIQLVGSLLQSCPPGSAGLLVTSEAMSRTVDATDRHTSVIFGDAAAACVFVQGEEERVAEVGWSTQGEKGPLLSFHLSDQPVHRFFVENDQLSLREDRTSSVHLVMHGRQVFKDMVTDLPRRIQLELERRGRQLSDFDHFAFHQANQRIVDAVVTRSQIDRSRVLSNIERLGNTSSASIPLMLAEASQSGRVQPGQRILLVGFGTGYSVGISELIWPT
ncbi:ketoacyl-ACP synthase III [bacterium]|nr:ketoacyl-ACP synthase III [bacterium]